ncbi:MAG: methylenetetrahydrofolate reductase, partial [Mesorhizobium sp.]
MSETIPAKDGQRVVQPVTQATLVKKAAPKSDYKPADVSPQRRVQRSFAVRLWSVRHSRLLEWFYAKFA